MAIFCSVAGFTSSVRKSPVRKSKDVCGLLAVTENVSC